MTAAWMRMCKGNNGLKVSSHEFELAKAAYVKNLDRSGENNPAYGYKWTEEQKQHLKDNHVGSTGQHIHDEEDRRHRSDVLKGNTYGKANKGRVSPTKGMKLGPFTEEHRKRLSEVMKGRKPWNKGLRRNK